MTLIHKSLFGIALLAGCIAGEVKGSACVWKVTDQAGAVLYLGGSVHALRPVDYPLPSAYTRAFDASDRLVFEMDPNDFEASSKEFGKAGRYPKGDSLKNHVDPRTYQYLRRFFAARGVPEEKFSTFRAWFIDVVLSAPPPEYFNLGVERFLVKKARSAKKPMGGLESVKEHNLVFEGLTDQQSEMALLLFFIHAGAKDGGGAKLIDYWKRGEVDGIAQHMRESYRDFPGFYDRLITARNQKWLPKIDTYLASKQKYFVVVGAAHMGGPNGLMALLRERGYKVEQL